MEDEEETFEKRAMDLLRELEITNSEEKKN